MIFSVCVGAMSEQTELKLDLLQYCRVEGVALPGRVLAPTGEEDPEAYRESLRIAADKLRDLTGTRVLDRFEADQRADIRAERGVDESMRLAANYTLKVRFMEAL